MKGKTQIDYFTLAVQRRTSTQMFLKNTATSYWMVANTQPNTNDVVQELQFISTDVDAANGPSLIREIDETQQHPPSDHDSKNKVVSSIIQMSQKILEIFIFQQLLSHQTHLQMSCSRENMFLRFTQGFLPQNVTFKDRFFKTNIVFLEYNVYILTEVRMLTHEPLPILPRPSRAVSRSWFNESPSK